MPCASQLVGGRMQFDQLNRRDHHAAPWNISCRGGLMTTDSGEIRRNVLRNRRWFLRHGGAAVRPPSRSTEKSWLHFRPPPVDFCGSRLAIGAATKRARAPASARERAPKPYKRA